MKQTVVTRQEARERGLTRYYLGTPCKHGHVAERLTRSTQCIPCNKENLRRWLDTADGKEKYRKAVRECQQRRRAKDPSLRKIEAKRAVAYFKTQRGKETRRRYFRARGYPLNYRLAASLRIRLCQAIKGKAKRGSAVRDLGCSIEFLIGYLESQFSPGRTWGNRGSVWHIDHIKPLSHYDLAVREQFLEACHWTNLRPYPARLNLSEGARR